MTGLTLHVAAEFLTKMKTCWVCWSNVFTRARLRDAFYFDFSENPFRLVEGLDEQVKLKEAMDGVYAYEYYPSAQGKYTVNITWGGQHIPKR